MTISCAQPCEVGPLGTGLECPSTVDAVKHSQEHLAACGSEPLEQAAAYWGIRVSDEPGAVEVRYVKPSTEGWEGETHYHLKRNVRGDILGITGGVIDSTSCDPLVLAHEIGHLLGYPDLDEPGSIMCYSTACAGWDRP